MGQRRGAELHREVGEVRDRIASWRRTRTKRSPMPEALWEAAVSLARQHGTYRVSQDLGVNYETLRKRSATPVRRRRRGAAKAKSPTFVEIKAASPAASAEPGSCVAVIEVEDGEGGKLTMRLGAAATIDVCSVVVAFRGGARRT